MPLFEYKGRSRGGEAVSGVLDGESQSAVATRLMSSGVTPVDIRPARSEQDVVGDLWRKLGGGRPTITDMILFSRQMHTITRAGIPLLRGLTSLKQSTHNHVLRITLEDVIASLESGRDLASSLARHPRVFTTFYVNIIRVGEASGTLDTAFLRMYEYLGQEQNVRSKVKSAVRYPIMVVAAIAVAVAIITLWVLPQFEPIFRSLGDDLPWATKVLMGTSAFVSENLLFVLGGVAVVSGAFVYYTRTPRGRYNWDRFKLAVPIIGSVTTKAILARVTRSFAVALESGVPIVHGLNIISRATGNEYMATRILSLRSGIERGESLSRSVTNANLFTPIVRQMIDVGEETGSMPELLGEVADFYEREVDYDLENLSAAMEPILIVGVGAMVLILALGVFLPLWEMAAHAGSAG